MEEQSWILQVVLPVIAGFCGWIFSKLQTSREKKKTDLEIINAAIKPLLVSISELTDRLKATTTDLMEEREKNLKLTTERTELLGKIENLEKEVRKLQRQVAKLTRNEKDDSDPVDA